MALSVKKNEVGEELYKRSETGKRVDVTVEEKPMFGDSEIHQMRIVSGEVLPEDVGQFIRDAIAQKTAWTKGKKSDSWRVPGKNITIYIIHQK